MQSRTGRGNPEKCLTSPLSMASRTPGKYASSYPDHACGAKITCTNCSRPGNCRFSQSDNQGARGRGQLLTPPPISSKLVSKLAIPSANSKHPDHKQFHPSNPLVLCDIRLMAISSNQDSRVSICIKRSFDPRRKFATSYVSRRNTWSKGKRLASEITYWSRNLAQRRPPTVYSMREILRHSR